MKKIFIISLLLICSFSLFSQIDGIGIDSDIDMYTSNGGDSVKEYTFYLSPFLRILISKKAYLEPCLLFYLLMESYSYDDFSQMSIGLGSRIGYIFYQNNLLALSIGGLAQFIYEMPPSGVSSTDFELYLYSAVFIRLDVNVTNNIILRIRQHICYLNFNMYSEGETFFGIDTQYYEFNPYFGIMFKF